MDKKMKYFKPSPDLAYNCCMHAWWDNAFTDEELDAICLMGERHIPSSGKVGINEGDQNQKIRKCTVSWIPPEGWLAERLETVINQLNGKYFGLNLWGFGEDFQYTVYKYHKKQTEHYDWHMDQGENNNSPRKLSIVLQLSNPDEYENGDLELFLGSEQQIKVQKKRGLIYAFPSYVLHRVSPVTKGTRRTLVVWVSGPKFV